MMDKLNVPAFKHITDTYAASDPVIAYFKNDQDQIEPIVAEYMIETDGNSVIATAAWVAYHDGEYIGDVVAWSPIPESREELRV